MIKLDPELGQMIADLYNNRFCGRLMIQRALDQGDTEGANRWVQHMIRAARDLRELGIPVLCVYTDKADKEENDSNCDDGQGPREDYSLAGGECAWES